MLHALSRQAIARPIVHVTRGQRNGPVTRLMSPSDLGQVLKPFVFLDLFDMAGSMAEQFHLHPHSGIATVTYVIVGSVGYEDTGGFQGVLPEGGVEWMKAGNGAWHGGAPGSSPHIQGFQLWLALPSASEMDSPESIYLPAADVLSVGPVTLLLGSYGGMTSRLTPPSPVTYLAVRLEAGQRWRFEPPAGESLCWIALAIGDLMAARPLSGGDLAVFAPSLEAIDFEATTDCTFVLGSAAPHPHELFLGHYSVHTSADTLRRGEARITEVGIERGLLRAT